MSMQEINRNLNRFIRENRVRAAEGLVDIGLDFVGKSSRRAPVKFGDLRGSGYLVTENVTLAETDDNGNVLQVGSDQAFAMHGNPVVEAGWGQIYAAIQHERTDFDHPKGGEAKYAEKTLHENENRYTDYVGNKARF